MSKACATPYSIYQGASKTITLTVLKKDGTAQDLTGSTVEFEVKPRAGDADTELVIQKSGTEGGPSAGVTFPAQTGDTLGQCTITLDPSDTSDLDPGQYEYDIVVTLSGGARHYVIPPSPFIVLSVVNQA